MYFDIREFRNAVKSDSELPLAVRLDIGYLSDEKLAVVMAKARLTQKGFEQLIAKM